MEDVARNTHTCNIKEIIEGLVSKKLLSVELFRDHDSDGNREIMGIITQKRARKVLESLKTLNEDDIETILSTCRVRGTVEDLFNYLDFIMLARTFKVDNLEQDNLEIDNLRETIKSSKGRSTLSFRKLREAVTGGRPAREQVELVLPEIEKRAL